MQNRIDDTEYDQYCLQRCLNRDVQIVFNAQNSVNAIVSQCKHQCISLLQNNIQLYDQCIREQQQQYQYQSRDDHNQIEHNYNKYDDEESNELRRAIACMQSSRVWCSVDDLEKEETVFPAYVITLQKKVACLLALDILLITCICLFMPKFTMNIINERVTTNIKLQFIIYWITTLLFFASILYLFASIQLVRLRISIAIALLNILWHLLLIIINYSNQSTRQKLFPLVNDVFYFLEFFVNILLFLAILIFSARINAIVQDQHGSDSQQELQYSNTQEINQHLQLQNNHLTLQNNHHELQNNHLALQKEDIAQLKEDVPLQDNTLIIKQNQNGDKFNKIQVVKSINNDLMTADKMLRESLGNRIPQKGMRDCNINDTYNHTYINDTIDKLNETKNIHLEETIYVNQNDISGYQNDIGDNQNNINNNQNYVNNNQNDKNANQIDVNNNKNDKDDNKNNFKQKQSNQIFTLTNLFQTDDNQTIYQIEDTKVQKICKSSQVYPIQYYDKKVEITKKKNADDDQINKEKISQEQSISRVTSQKHISSTPNVKTLYRKDQSQKSLTTKNSTQNYLLDTTADRSLNLTNHQLLMISKIQSSNKQFQSNRSNLNNNFIKHQYDMNYWGSQFCEHSPAIKIRRTIERFNIHIPPSIEDQKMSELQKLNEQQIQKQQEQRINKMKNAEQELQKQISLLHQNQQKLKQQHEQELYQKLNEKEVREKNLQQELSFVIQQNERRKKELKEYVEQEQLNKLNEPSNKKSALLLMNPTVTIQEEEEQNNSSLIHYQNQSESVQQNPILKNDNNKRQNNNNELQNIANSQINEVNKTLNRNNSTLNRDNLNGQQKNKKQQKMGSSVKMNPCIVEEEESLEKEQNLIVFDDDFHDKETDKYIDVNTFVRNNSVSLSLQNSHSFSKFPLSVLKDKDYPNQVMNIEQDKNKLIYDKLPELLQHQQVDNAIDKQKNNSNVLTTNDQNEDKESPHRQFNISRLNQTANSFYISKSNTQQQSTVFLTPTNPSTTYQNQVIGDIRRSENLWDKRPNTSNSTQKPILNINNFNKGNNNKNNNNSTIQNLDNHRQIQRQSLIRQAENYLNKHNNTNYSGRGADAIANDEGSSRMELIGQDDVNMSPETTQREVNPFRVLQDYRMKGISDFDENILKQISQTQPDYSKSEYQKMKQIFIRGESNSRLQSRPLKYQQNSSNNQQQQVESVYNLII